MSLKPNVRRAVTISDHTASTASKAPSRIGNTPSAQKDLHPLPPMHIGAQDLTLEGLQQRLLDLHEALRVRTDAMAKNPLTAPAFERGVKFQNTSSSSQLITVTFPHSLGRAPTNGVTCVHATGHEFSGYSVPNPNGEDPATHQTVSAFLRPNSTGYFTFMLHAD